MLNRRSLSFLVALAVALSLTPRGSAATLSPAEQGSSDQKLYKAYSEFFFLKRNMDFALEMSLRESFLTWLFQGINVEVAVRSKDDPSGTLAAIDPPELKGLDEESYAFPDSLLDAPLRIRYLANEKYQRTEFNHKFLQARLIKDQLIRTATAEDKKRMFKYDLESTILAYNNNKYREVIMQSDELVDRYGFNQMGDLIFCRAESYLALQMYDQAQSDYQSVVETSDDSWYRLRSLGRLISLAGDKGATKQVLEYWQQYQIENGEKREETYWSTAELVSRYLMAGEEWKEAQALLDSIPADLSFSLTVKLRSADCSLALLELDDAEARYEEILAPVKGKKLSDEETNDARLKLGYVEFLRGRFDVAFERFNSIQGVGDVAERGQLSAVWCLYRLSAYQQVIDRCNLFVKEYPQSQYFYEVRTLTGISEEMLGKGDSALQNYRVVMSALDDRQDFYDFNRELGAINSAVGRLQAIESQIFLGGERDLFPAYMKIRRELLGLVEGLKFARAIKATPFLKEVLKEQKALYETFENQSDLEDQIYDAQDAMMLEEYQKGIGKLTDIGSEISSGIKFYKAQQPLAQREQDKLYESQVSDTLKAKLEREWVATQKAIALTRQYLDRNMSTADPMTLIEITSIETGLVSLQDQILNVRSSLRKFGQDKVVTNIDIWSDFAYQRYTYGGLSFDYLYSKENRIEELDQYIRQVGTLLQEREAARRDTISLAADLIPASNPGEPPYFAPSVPLWGTTKPTSPLSDQMTNEEAAQSVDTVTAMETTPDGQPEAPTTDGEVKEEVVPSTDTEMENSVPADFEPENEGMALPGDTPAESSEPGLESPSDSQGQSEAPTNSETQNEEVAPPGGSELENTAPEGIEPTSEPEVEPEVPTLGNMETTTPDSLGKDSTDVPPPETTGSEEPQNAPSIP